MGLLNTLLSYIESRSGGHGGTSGTIACRAKHALLKRLALTHPGFEPLSLYIHPFTWMFMSSRAKTLIKGKF